MVLAPVAPQQDKHITLITRAQNYKCVIPDATLQYLIRRHGGETTDQLTTRLLGIAAEKFVVDLLSDASTLVRDILIIKNIILYILFRLGPVAWVKLTVQQKKHVTR